MKKRDKKAKPLARITDEERVEYAKRRALFDRAQIAALAAAAYLDAYGEELRQRYDLPVAYDLDLSDGSVTARTMNG